MKKIFFTPGPAHLYPTVDAHVRNALDSQILSLSHRSKAYEAIHSRAVDNVKALLNVPEDFHVLFHASATEIWERLIQNCVKEHSYHFVNGSFSSRFFSIAGQLNRSPIKSEASWGEGFQFSTDQVPGDTEMINFTHNETSTGVMLPIEEIYAFRDSHPNALLTLDMVSSVPHPVIDWTKLDAAYFSVQKGMGLPAGLGVLIVGPRCIDKSKELAEAGHSTGSYHSFASQLSKSVKNQTPETPNLLNIYLLGAVVGDMLEKGVDQIRKETETKAQMLYDFFENHPTMSPFVKDKGFRSKTVIVVDVDGDASVLMDKTAEEGLIMGSGYGKMKGKQLRIANFPAVSVEEVKRLIALL